MATRSEIFDIYSQAYDRQKQAVMPLKDFLEGCRKDPSMYATAAERMLTAIGEPQMVNPHRGRPSARRRSRRPRDG